MKKCPFCAEDIQDAAIVCKHCGREIARSQFTVEENSGGDASTPAQKQTQKSAVILLLLLLVLGILASIADPDGDQLAAFGSYLFGGLRTAAGKLSLQDIQSKVAADFEQQYEIAKRNGTPIDVCVHAGLVAEGYLQAQNEAAYQRWKQIEKADCDKAGVPK